MRTKFKFLVPVNNQKNDFITIFTFEDEGTSIEKKLENFYNKDKKQNKTIITLNAFLIMRQEIQPFYNTTKKFTSFMLKEIQDHYKGLGEIVGVSKKDLEELDEYYCILGKDSEIKVWDSFYEIVSAICLLNKDLIKDGIIFEKETVEE